MAKNILLIEADDTFAAGLSEALESRGASVTRSASGNEGFELAQDGKFDAIVLCVELPKTSGYAVCNKLKKHDRLQSIPVVLMSSEATPKTFEQHRRLRARAEEYVIKPCEYSEVVDKLHELVGLSDGAAAGSSDRDEDLELLENAFDSLEMSDDSEMVLADDEVEEIALDSLEVVDSSLDDVGSADLALDSMEEHHTDAFSSEGLSDDSDEDDLFGSLTDDEPPSQDEDDELSSAYDALDSLGSDAGAAPPADSEDVIGVLGLGEEDLATSADDAIDSLGGSLRVGTPIPPAEDALAGLMSLDKESIATIDTSEDSPGRASASGATARRLAKLEEENSSLRRDRSELESKVAGVEDDLRAKTNELEAFKAGGGGGSREALKLKSELTQKNKEILSLKDTINEKEKAELEWQERETELELKAADLEEKALQAEAQVKTLTEKAEALNERLERVQSELEESYQAGRRASELEAELESSAQERQQVGEELERAKTKVNAAEARGEELQRKVSDLETDLNLGREELENLQRDLDGAREQANERLGEIDSLSEQVNRLERENSRNEDRALKAYQKLKSDELLREKTRKALAVALELLDEAPGQASDSEDDLRLESA